MASCIRLCALTCCAALLLFTSSHATDEVIHRTLDDNTLEQTFILNLVTDTGLVDRYTPAEISEISFQYLNEGDFQNYFSLSSQTGNIKTSQLVDRDVLCPMQETCQIEMNIAVLPNNYFEVIKVFITIEDENDNAPKFNPRSVAYEIPETTAPGLITPLVPAQDLDSPNNGIKQYRLSDPSGYFYLDVNNIGDGTLEIQLRLITQLDREEESTYQMQVLAVDSGTPVRTGTLDLTITVRDVNDNHPSFVLSTYEIDVPENFDIDETIIQVSANDEDSGDNGEVRYEFSTDTQRDLGDLFFINAQTGAISLQQPLNFEEEHLYSLTVIAEDQGLNSVPSSAKVLVHVHDVNDVTPEIVLNEAPPDGTIRITENQSAPTYIGHISILDDDSGLNGQVECQLNNDRQFELEELHEKEYKIMATVSLDREAQALISLIITCHDLGIPRLQSQLQLQIEVTDADDNEPVFEYDEYIVNIAENNEVGVVMTQVYAYDDDIGANGQVVYSLQTASDSFAIHPQSGVITALRSFDREEQDSYEITVIATDQGVEAQSSTTTVFVNITDLDDQRPVFFPNQEWVFYVREDVPKGTSIGTVTAADSDLPPNNNFTYYLDQEFNAENRFAINPYTGNIFTNRLLDRELRQVYEVHIIAESTTDAMMTNSMFVEVNIVDVNDNDPVISFPTSDTNIVTISNSAPIGYKVTRIMAYDSDEGDNSELSYQITTINGSKVEGFQIDSESGSIFVSYDLRDLQTTNFTLQVIVTDKGLPQRTSVTSLYINVNSSYAYPRGPPNGQANGNNNSQSDSNTVNLVPILIGSIFGAVVVTLLVVIVILLILRRRKLETAEGAKMWVQRGNSTCSTNGTGQFPEEQDHQYSAPTSDQVKYTPDDPQARSDSPHSSNRDSHGEKDSDSGCFDLSHSDSQSSAESSHHGSNQQVHTGVKGPSVVQTKCYHPHNHTSKPPFTTPASRSQSFSKPDNYTRIPPQTDLPLHKALLQASVVGSSPNDSLSEELPPPPPPLLGTYPISQASYVRRNQPDNRPFPPPPPQAGISRPQHYPRFTDYLQNESHQLKQRGHVYRVSNPRQSKEGGTNRKTVRFSADSKNCETAFIDPSHLNHLQEQNHRAVPNNYVDPESLRNIAMGSQTVNNQTVLPLVPQGRDSGVCMRGLSSLELDSLV